MKIELEILGEPKAQMRHRHTSIGKFVHTYDPSTGKKKSFLSVVQDNAPEKPLDEPISLEVYFYMSRPKNHYRSGKNSELLKDSAPLYHISKPDLDNLLKFCLDSLNKVFWRDDSLVWCINARKKYSDKPRTVIIIESLPIKIKEKEPVKTETNLF